METLSGKVAVITGGASGIGLAMARNFAAQGMKLVLADIEKDALEKEVRSFREAGTPVESMIVDVSVEEQVNALADLAFKAFGQVHVLCNNAGVSTPALRMRAWESSIADWQWLHNVNFMGVLYGVRAFVPRMLASGEQGHVVNTASVAGLLTGSNPYHVSKNEVTCLTEGLYRDLRGLQAKVSASVLCPGLIRTPIIDAERNRPERFGPATGIGHLPQDIQRLASDFKATLDKGWEPGRVAEEVTAGILADRFYILPAQAGLVDLIRLRMQDIIEQRNPTIVPPLV